MSEPPSSDGPTARSDAAARLAELLGDVMGEPPRAPEGEAPAAGDRPRRRLRRRDLEVDLEADLEELPTAPTDRSEGEEPATEPVPVVAPTPSDEPSTDPVADEPATEEVDAVPTGFPPAGEDPTGADRDDDAFGTDDEVDLDDDAFGTDDEVDLDDDTDADRAPVAAGARDGDDEQGGDAGPPGVAWAGPGRRRTGDRPRTEPRHDERDVDPVRLPRITVRAVAFGTVLALLIAAIPALGWIGKERLLTSRGGEVVDSDREPSEPGYLAVVEPTPTALVVHRDDEGVPTSAAVLSLGAGDTGGTVLLVPLTLQVHEVVYFNRIIDGWDQLGDLDAFRKSIEDVLGVALPAPTIELSDDDLATLAAPVAPLDIDVARQVVLDDGTTMSSGPTQVGADQLGPYLRAGDDSESEVARLERIGDVWTAWLDAIGESGGEEPIGAAATGIGRFLRVLASGPHVVEVLDVTEGDLVYGAEPYLVPAEGFNEQVLDAVPLPASPRPGRRFTVKLLNGDAGEDLPMTLVRELGLAGAAVEWVGNADELGRSDSLVEFASDEREQEAQMVAGLLRDAEVDQMSTRRAEAEGVDLVITVGRDTIEEYAP